MGGPEISDNLFCLSFPNPGLLDTITHSCGFFQLLHLLNSIGKL